MTESGQVTHDLYGHDGRSELLTLLPSHPITLLDVGCGYGGFGQSLARERPDIRAVALEPDAAAAAAARSHYAEVAVGIFPDDVVGSGYDAICFNDVLEHLVDPWQALRQTRSLLAPGGVVIASIPNIRYAPVLWDLLFKGSWDYVETGTLDRTHLRFFTRSSIADLFSSAGFAVQTVQPLNPAMGRRWRWLAACPEPLRDLRYLQFAVRATVN